MLVVRSAVAGLAIIGAVAAAIALRPAPAAAPVQAPSPDGIPGAVAGPPPATAAALVVDLAGLDGAPRTVQILVLADHRGGFVWEARLPAGATAARLRADLRDPGPWRAVDHAGAWSGYEVAALRAATIAAFPPLPASAAVRHGWVAATAARTLAWSAPGPARIALGQGWEWQGEVTGVDPWMPQRDGLELLWTAPDGATAALAPFLHQTFRAEALPGARERLVAAGPKHLRVRARPLVEGGHRWELRLDGRRLAGGTVAVGPGRPPGFVRIDPARPRWFLEPDGRAFEPVGWVVAYPVDRPYGHGYRPYLESDQTLEGMLRQVDAVADGGGTALRLWLCDWWGGLEWSAEQDAYLGMGRWNLRHAWQVDRVLEHCAGRGIRVLFTHYNHVRLSQGYSWPSHPYRAFLNTPADYWRDPRAAAASDAVLAAAAARWASDPTVFAWDHMSETDLVAHGAWPAAKAHIGERLARLRAADPWRRPAGNHLCIHTHDPAFLRSPALDYVTSNAYPMVAGAGPDQADAVAAFARTWADAGKPVLIAEYGGHWAGDPVPAMGTALHAGLWAGLGSPLAGAPMGWFWNAIAGEGWGPAWGAAAAFAAGDDPAAEDTAERGFWRARPAAVSGAPAERLPKAYQVGSALRRRLILLDPASTARREREAPPTAAAGVRVDGLRPGRWRIETWDGIARRPVAVELASVGADGALAVAVPPFRGVRALRLAHDPDAVLPPPVAAPGAGALPGGTAPSGLEWVLHPQADPPGPELAARILWEVPIALPPGSGGRAPRAFAADGSAIPCAWTRDDHGWVVRLPGTTRGPVTIRDAAEPGPGWDPDLLAVGLVADAVAWRGRIPADHAGMAAAWAGASGPRRRAGIEAVDLTGDATGLGPEGVLTRITGPVWLPAGTQVFSVNADDGITLALDGAPVVAWGGSHDMEVPNRPAADLWQRCGSVTATAGFHALEIFHAQGGGAQLARAGWAASGAALAPLPAWRCHGRMPVAVEIRRGGRTAAMLHPVPDLELRAPRRRLGRIDLEADSIRGLRLLPDAGRQMIDVAGGPLPVRSPAAWAEPCSLTLRRLAGPAVEVLAWDATAAVVLLADGRPLGARIAAPGAPAQWPLPATLARAALELRAADAAPGTAVTWAALPAPPAPGRIPGLGAAVTMAWLTAGADADALAAHAAACAAAGERPWPAPDLDRRQAAVRALLRDLAARGLLGAAP
ncbi:MAG: hypothetical protein RLZZ127_428 [Planctomycetota bacterium]|jgi:hypothetical protein